MSFNKPTDLSKLKDHYGLALEEIKLERSINKMAVLINSLADRNHLAHLQDEMNHQKRQLRSLRKLRDQ